VSDLTDKQEMFCREYLACEFNATEAARRAGYKQARASGCENLAKPNIQARIAELNKERIERVEADADYLLKRLLNESEADLADIVDDDGNVLPIRKWPKIWRQGLVAGIDVERVFAGKGEDREQVGEIVKVKLADRIRRLELLGKHISVGAFAERHDHNHNHTGTIEHTEVPAEDKQLIRELRKKRGESRVTH
jgi:phage terminase small subunit